MSDFAPHAPRLTEVLGDDPRCPKCGGAGAYISVSYRPAERSQYHAGKIWWPEHLKLDCLRCGYDMGRRLPADAKTSEDHHHG